MINNDKFLHTTCFRVSKASSCTSGNSLSVHKTTNDTDTYESNNAIQTRDNDFGTLNKWMCDNYIYNNAANLLLRMLQNKHNTGDNINDKQSDLHEIDGMLTVYVMKRLLYTFLF